MLLVHQAGTVKVGEVVRYTLTYTPSSDRILPSPSQLHVKIKNTSAIPLRAAYLHGPYTLHVAAYPSTFKPNEKFDSALEDGVPEFEPNLKAGGHWHAKLVIPERIREHGDKANSKRNIDGSPRSVTWIIEVASQILFSNTASVHYEFLVGRDRRSLEIGFAAVAGMGHGEPGQVQDHKPRDTLSSSHSSQPKGVYSRAIGLVVEDTAALWSKPALPTWPVEKETPTAAHGGMLTKTKSRSSTGMETEKPKLERKKRKLHLVVLTHGLHSNTGADLLYMKESIDETVRQAKASVKEKRRLSREMKRTQARNSKDISGERSQSKATQKKVDTAEDDESDDEQVIVRGFPGNSVRTERGIQYLGKRLAKYILTMTYPDQPVLPKAKSITKSLGDGFSNATSRFSISGKSSNKDSSAEITPPKRDDLAYTYASISFIGHSLGGLVQTYAIAYIQKHSPQFFENITPINFVALATPFLGLSNENPLYVKFALDFGLVGRTGQDLGLTWRAPNVAKSGWSTMISGFGSNTNEERQPHEDTGSKPLLRILPNGPAHYVLKKFRNRTLYCNVVNDGVVPLRTSALLFLDWRGLGKVENARRENGLIGTMAAFGWAELTGQNSVSHRPSTARSEDEDSLKNEQIDTTSTRDNGQTTPYEWPEFKTEATDRAETQKSKSIQQVPQMASSEAGEQNLETVPNVPVSKDAESDAMKAYTLPNNPLTDFINLFRPSPSKSQSSSSKKPSNKTVKAYKRAQTIKSGSNEGKSQTGDTSAEASLSPSKGADEAKPTDSNERPSPGVARGQSYVDDPSGAPPPKTSIFDAATDLLNPPLPPESWFIDPSNRSRTVFHDRVYQPDDIPLPPPKKPKLPRSISSSGSLRSNARSQSVGDRPADTASMKVEEKIARAYHNGMSWRKVLVRLEPDAHNNIIVRRMFANAYGWDVIKHLCDTHFADTYASNTADDFESTKDRANILGESSTEMGNQVDGQSSLRRPRSTTDLCEEVDEVADLEAASVARGSLTSSIVNPTLRSTRSQDSATWTDSILADDIDDADSDDEVVGPMETFNRFWSWAPKTDGKSNAERSDTHDAKVAVRTQQTERNKDERAANGAKIAEELTLSPETISPHRGLGVAEREAAIAPTYEADMVAPFVHDASQPSQLTESPTKTKGTSEVGLKKPPEAHITSRSGSPEVVREQASGAGVTEEIARAAQSPTDGHAK